MMKPNVTTIKVTTETRERLSKYGVYGNTMDQIVNKILEKVEAK